jgi:hypothetical protein
MLKPVIAYSKVLSCIHLEGQTSVKVVGTPADFRNGHILIKVQKR